MQGDQLMSFSYDIDHHHEAVDAVFIHLVENILMRGASLDQKRLDQSEALSRMGLDWYGLTCFPSNCGGEAMPLP